MHQEPATTATRASGSACPSSARASEWRVSKEQLAAAQRASLYHARKWGPAPAALVGQGG